MRAQRNVVNSLSSSSPVHMNTDAKQEQTIPILKEEKVRKSRGGGRWREFGRYFDLARIKDEAKKLSSSNAVR